MRSVLIIVNAGFALIFLAAFATLVLAPASLERRAHRELVERIAAAAAERHPQFLSPGWTDALTAALERDVAAARESVVSPGPVADRFRSYVDGRVEGLNAALRRLEDWARGRYRELFDELIADLRIFTATNALVSVLAFLLARAQTQGRAIVLASAILAMTVVTSAGLYLFKQDWLHTLVFAAYVGYGYIIGVIFVAAFLFDAVFNRGRVVNFVLLALSSGVRHS
jgi:hypothetical protein